MEIGNQVRNLKTRVVGTITALEEKNAVVKYDFENGTVEKPMKIQDLELLNVEEYRLVEKLVLAKAAKKAADEVLKQTTSEAAAAEDDMIEYLRRNSLESTKAYEGLGVAVIDGFSVKPNITEENRPAAFEWIRKIGRGEVIKEQIHAATLASLMTQIIDEGKEKIPESISYFLKPKLAVRKK